MDDNPLFCKVNGFIRNLGACADLIVHSSSTDRTFYINLLFTSHQLLDEIFTECDSDVWRQLSSPDKSDVLSFLPLSPRGGAKRGRGAR